FAHVRFAIHFSLHGPRHPPVLHSFPTRRSSDLSLCQAKATAGSTKKGLRIPSPGFSPSFVPRRNRFRQGWTANRTHSPSLARNGVLGDQSASGIRLLQTSPDGTSGPE